MYVALLYVERGDIQKDEELNLGLVYEESVDLIKTDMTSSHQKAHYAHVSEKVWGGTSSWQAIQMIQNNLTKLTNCWIDQNILLQLKVSTASQDFLCQYTKPESVLSFWTVMDILREFLESSTIHGLAYISTAKVIS